VIFGRYVANSYRVAALVGFPGAGGHRVVGFGAGQSLAGPVFPRLDPSGLWITLVPRQEGLEQFEAFASAEKTLHVNPGGHGDVPTFERESTERFFTRHLTKADTSEAAA
jgi:hypothetical protein